MSLEPRQFKSRNEMRRIHREEAAGIPVIFARTKEECRKECYATFGFDPFLAKNKGRLVPVGCGHYVCREYKDTLLAIALRRQMETAAFQ